MAKNTRALSGAAKDAYLGRAIRAEPELTGPARERLTVRLRGEIASLTLRATAAGETATRMPELEASEPPDESSIASPLIEDSGSPPPTTAPSSLAFRSSTPFDPYSPNVIVVIRTRGREAVLAQLSQIASIDELRILAREQQLGIASELAEPDDVRLAIVEAAERRIANRRAAAS